MLKKVSCFLDASVEKMLENGATTGDLATALGLLPAMMRKQEDADRAMPPLSPDAYVVIPERRSHVYQVMVNPKTLVAVWNAFRVEGTIRMRGRRLVVEIACFAKRGRTPTHQATVVFNYGGHDFGRDESL